MSITYKGFTITICGNPLHSRDWIVAPIGKPDQEELFENYTLEQVKNLIDVTLN